MAEPLFGAATMESRARVGESDSETMCDDCIIRLDKPLLFSVEFVHGVRDDVFKLDDENVARTHALFWWCIHITKRSRYLEER
jgi:hypothetical protein